MLAKLNIRVGHNLLNFINTASEITHQPKTRIIRELIIRGLQTFTEDEMKVTAENAKKEVEYNVLTSKIKDLVRMAFYSSNSDRLLEKVRYTGNMELYYEIESLLKKREECLREMIRNEREREIEKEN